VSSEWSTSLTSGVDLHLALPDGVPRREGLERVLRDAVRSGRLPAGSRLPSTRALAAELGLARGTVSGAYEQLAAEGFLVPARGSGTVVADVPLSRPTDEPDVSGGSEPSPPHDLRPGSPDVSSFPVQAWLRAARKAVGAAPAAAFDYGDPRGQLVLREELAGYLARTRGVVADPGDVVVTSGYVQALALAATVLGRGPVAMEDPGLPFHRAVVRRAGRSVVPLPVDEDGARPADLAGTGADLAVVTPAHQYPTGVPLSPRRRGELLDWALQDPGRHVVLEDDYDGEFRYDRQPVGALQGRAPDAVVYVGSAAKTLAPGLRLAWMVVPRRLRDELVEAKRHADLATEAIGQLTLAELIGSHAYDRHVRATRLRYRRRSDQLAAVLERRAGRNARARAPHSIAAGLQTVVHVPDEAEVLDRAGRAGLGLEGLGEHFHGGRGRPGVVVGFARPRDAAYPRALEVLSRVLP